MKKKTTNNFNYNFTSGPTSDIPLTPHHGGPIFSMDIKNDQIVTTSSDHGARVYNLQTGKQIRELYNKQYGHTEWVTSAKILSSGQIITGGMDSKLCIWDSKQVKCIDLTEHRGSISKILTDSTESVFFSSSFDTSIRIYSTSSFNNLSVLKGVHLKPVTDFYVNNSMLISADRDGGIAVWDLNQEKSIFFKPGYHQGQISNIVLDTDGGINKNSQNIIFTSGINDGLIIGLDMRTSQKIISKRVHSAAINLLRVSIDSGLLFSGSADKTIKVFDIRKELSEMCILKATDAVFCGDIFGSGFLCAGCGDGSILGYDLNSFDCVWGYGVEEAGGVRCLQILADKGKIITAGDSGKGLQVVFD